MFSGNLNNSQGLISSSNSDDHDVVNILGCNSTYIVSTRGLIFTVAEIYKSQPNLVLGSHSDPVAEDPSTLRIHGSQQQQHRSLLLETASGQRPLVALVMEPASAVGLLTDKYGVGGGNPNSNYGNSGYSH